MSTSITHTSRLNIRLESWQQQPESRKPNTDLNALCLWMVTIHRCIEADVPKFEVRFVKSGVDVFVWVVPKPAYPDLTTVFLQGGSFLRATMKHMPDEWENSKVTHPHFYALYEQESLSLSTQNAGASSTPPWVRL